MLIATACLGLVTTGPLGDPECSSPFENFFISVPASLRFSALVLVGPMGIGLLRVWRVVVTISLNAGFGDGIDQLLQVSIRQKQSTADIISQRHAGSSLAVVLRHDHTAISARTAGARAAPSSPDRSA